MTEEEITLLIEAFRNQGYAPLITTAQAAQIANKSPKTICDWSSRGRLNQSKVGKGRGCLYILSEFVRFICTGGDA